MSRWSQWTWIEGWIQRVQGMTKKRRWLGFTMKTFFRLIFNFAPLFNLPFRETRGVRLTFGRRIKGQFFIWSFFSIEFLFHFLLLDLRSNNIIFWEVDFIGMFEILLVLLHFGRIVNWVYFCVSPAVFAFVLVSLLLRLHNYLFFLLVFNQFLGICDSLSLIRVGFFNHLAFCFFVNIHQHQGILDQIKFYKIVQRGISRETWGMVYFKDDWVEKLVDHDVDS